MQQEFAGNVTYQACVWEPPGGLPAAGSDLGWQQCSHLWQLLASSIWRGLSHPD